jgi:hypothetical protein
MSGPLDRLIARVTGTEPAVRAAAPTLFGETDKDTEWKGEVVDEQVESAAPSRRAPVVPRNDSAAPMISPAPEPAALRTVEPVNPIQIRHPGDRPESEIAERPVAPRRDPPVESAAGQPAQAERTPLRWIVPPPVVQEHVRPVTLRAEPGTAPNPWAGTDGPPTVTPVPDTIVIEIGRIELTPPRPKQTPAPEARRDGSVTLASYLADRRSGKR